MNWKLIMGIVSGLAFFVLLTYMLQAHETKQNEASPPDLKVQNGESVNTAAMGGYCWNEEGMGVCADAAPPEENLDEEQALSASPGQTVELNFAAAPKSIKIEEKFEEEAWTEQQLKDFQLTLPEETGTYTYRISGEWGPGSVSYAFLVIAE